MENNTSISKSFQEEFLDELIQKAWFKLEDADLLKEDLRPILQERIMLYIYKEIQDNQNDVDMVTRLLGQEKYEELTARLRLIIPDFDDFIYEIYAQFEDEYLENFKK